MLQIFSSFSESSFDDRIDEHEDASLVSQKLTSKVRYEEITKNHQKIANTMKENVENTLNKKNLSPFKVIIVGIKLVDGK